jgi:hypothetical protein
VDLAELEKLYVPDGPILRNFRDGGYSVESINTVVQTSGDARVVKATITARHPKAPEPLVPVACCRPGDLLLGPLPGSGSTGAAAR